MPYEGGPEKAIQVDRALLIEHELTGDELAFLLDRLDVTKRLQGCERYELSARSWSPAISAQAVTPASLTTSVS